MIILRHHFLASPFPRDLCQQWADLFQMSAADRRLDRRSPPFSSFFFLTYERAKHTYVFFFASLIALPNGHRQKGQPTPFESNKKKMNKKFVGQMNRERRKTSKQGHPSVSRWIAENTQKHVFRTNVQEKKSTFIRHPTKKSTFIRHQTQQFPLPHSFFWKGKRRAAVH